MNKRLIITLAVILFSAVGFAQKNNPKAFLKDKQQEKTLASLKSVDGTRLYSMDYKADYHLQNFIDASMPSQSELISKSAAMLLDANKLALAKGYVDKPACSSFVARTPEGDRLFCRNFDYHWEDAADIIMRTSSENGYRSIAMVAASFPGFKGAQLQDGKTDLSGLVVAPYCQMDGMNEKGLCISVLQLSGECAAQYVEGKPAVMTSVMMRMVLDRAANVDEALALIDGINFFTNSDLIGKEKQCNYHFFLADASGKSVILEFIRKDGPKTDSPWVANVINRNAVTNSYLSPGWEKVSYDARDKRLDILDETLSLTHGIVSEDVAMDMLKAVSQKHTQWSVVYNITKGTATVCMLGDFARKYSFKMKGRKGWTK